MEGEGYRGIEREKDGGSVGVYLYGLPLNDPAPGGTRMLEQQLPRHDNQEKYMKGQ